MSKIDRPSIITPNAMPDEHKDGTTVPVASHHVAPVAPVNHVEPVDADAEITKVTKVDTIGPRDSRLHSHLQQAKVVDAGTAAASDASDASGATAAAYAESEAESAPEAEAEVVEHQGEAESVHGVRTIINPQRTTAGPHPAVMVSEHDGETPEEAAEREKQDKIAEEAERIVKELDVLKRIREFNAAHHAKGKGGATSGAAADGGTADDDLASFDFDGDYDDGADLSGMHLFSGDKDGYSGDEDDDYGSFDADVDVEADADDFAATDRDAVSALDSSDRYDPNSQSTSRSLVHSSARARSTARARGRASSAGVGGNNIGAFIRAANQVPMLSKEEEAELAKRLRDFNDLDAAARLVMSHLRLVVSVARGFSGYGLPLADLIQEGNIGLMKAVKHFEPDVGGRLAAFAVHWIKSEITDYIIRNWRMVKVATTKAQRRLFFNIRQLKKSLGWMKEQERENIATNLGVSTNVVAEMETRMAGSDIGFDVDESDGDRGMGAGAMSPASYLEDENSNFAQAFENSDYAAWELKKLREALNSLDDRSRYILKRRWLDEEKATLQELSLELKVSIERVRQLENNAMKKVKTLLLSAGVNAADEDEATSSGAMVAAQSRAALLENKAPKPAALTYKPLPKVEELAATAVANKSKIKAASTKAAKASKVTKVTKATKATKASASAKAAKPTASAKATTTTNRATKSKATTVKATIKRAAKSAKATAPESASKSVAKSVAEPMVD